MILIARHGMKHYIYKVAYLQARDGEFVRFVLILVAFRFDNVIVGRHFRNRSVFLYHPDTQHSLLAVYSIPCPVFAVGLKFVLRILLQSAFIADINQLARHTCEQYIVAQAYSEIEGKL